MITQTAGIGSTELAFEHAYALLWPDVLRFALAWTNDWASAEDLAQDAFVQLWRGRERLDWSRPLMPWLLRVTRNRATDRIRALRRWGPSDQRQLATPTVEREAWLDVQAAMQKLTHEERGALVLTTLLGLTSIEAAEVLGLTDGAVRAAVSRGRQKLEVER